MASFTTGNDAWDQGLGALSGSLFPDPSKIAQAGYYGAQQRKAGIEADIESQKWANQVTLGNYITGRYGNQQPTAGTASNGPAAPTPGLPPQLTSGTPPPMSPPSGSGAPPAPNTTTSDGKVPNNDTSAGRLHPATIMPGGGGQVAAAPAGANGSPAPISLDLGQLTGMSILANLPPAAQQQAIQTLAVGLNNGGYVATPTGRQALADIMASQGNNALVQERSNLATTGMQVAGQRDVAGIQAGSAANVAGINQRGETTRKGMDPVNVLDPVTHQGITIPNAQFNAGQPQVGPASSPTPAPGPTPAFGPSSITPPPPIGNVTIQPGNTAPPGVPTPTASGAPATGRANYGVYNADAQKPQMFFNPTLRQFKTINQAEWAAMPDHDAWRPATADDVKPFTVGGAAPGTTAIVPSAEAPLGPRLPAAGAAPGPGATGQDISPGQSPAAGPAPGQGSPATQPSASSIIQPQYYSAAPTSEVQNAWQTPTTWINPVTGAVLNNTTKAQLSARPDASAWQPTTQDDLSKATDYTDPTGHFNSMTRQQFLQTVPPDKRAGWHGTGQNEMLSQPRIVNGQPGFGSQAGNVATPGAQPMPSDPNQVAAANQQSLTSAALAATDPNAPLTDRLSTSIVQGQQAGPVAKSDPQKDYEATKIRTNTIGETYAADAKSWLTNTNEATLAPEARAMLDNRVAQLKRSDPRMDDRRATQTALGEMMQAGYIQSPSAVSRSVLGRGNYKAVHVPNINGDGTHEAIELPFDPKGGFAKENKTGGIPSTLSSAIIGPAQAAQTSAQTTQTTAQNALGPKLSDIPVPAGWQPGRTGTTAQGVPFVVGTDGLPHAQTAAPTSTAPAPAPAPAPARTSAPQQPQAQPQLSSIVNNTSEGGFQGKGPGYATRQAYDRAMATTRNRLVHALPPGKPADINAINRQAERELGPRPADVNAQVFQREVQRLMALGQSPAEATRHARELTGY